MAASLPTAPVVPTCWVLIFALAWPALAMGLEVKPPAKPASGAGKPAAKAAVEAPPSGATKPASADMAALDDAARVMLGDYVAAYNRGDAQALAQHWSEQGVYVDEESGEEIVGRAAIEADLADLFAENESLSLAVSLNAVRAIRPDVLQLTGQAVTRFSVEETRDSKFTAILIREQDRWLSTPFTNRLPTTSHYEHLQSLEWLVGRWVDDNQGETSESPASIPRPLSRIAVPRAFLYD